ncbi:AsmA family protein [Roseomonas sp. HF4]|uniref:AsmA family protein n=1 Tax=Roseomonas sp. HF4 TaxID=2562313 RepID=UPI0010C0D7C8|nr:AsmA family protein [Roseomonas sp. HF4]
MRRRTKILLGLVGAIVLLGGGAVLTLPQVELGPFAAARASAALGREVTIGSLRVRPGFPTRVALRDARVANIEGGSHPVMARLGRLDATIAPLPLLWGNVALAEVAAEGFALLLERAPGRVANWRFAGAPPAAPAGPPPMPAALRVTDAEIVFRTTGGSELRTRIDTASLAAAPADRPASLAAAGSYNGVAVAIEAALFSRDALRAGGALPVTLRATAEDTALLFEGTATDPLNADGLDGRITFAASTPRAVLAMAGVAEGPTVPLEFTGRASRDGDLWRLTEATGTLDGVAFRAALLELAEGGAGRPDAVRVRLDLDRLDLDPLLAGRAEAAGPPFRVPEAPDPQINAEITATAFGHARLSGRDARMTAELAPGRITASAAFEPTSGGRVEVEAEMLPQGEGATASVGVRMRDADLDALRSALGVHAIPLEGPIDVDAQVAAEGATLAAALEGARISAVAAMTGGTIAREVIEMASTDLRALLRTSRGRTRISCLLAAVDIRGGQGEAAPLRIRAGAGTIAGFATFDLNRRRVDLLIGSERATTDFLALDIPVRVSGSFADPDIAPARWSREGRERLQRGALAPLPPDLMDLARQSPCHVGRSLRR